MELTGVQKRDTVKHLNEDVLVGHFSMLEKRLLAVSGGSTTPSSLTSHTTPSSRQSSYFCGDALTIADLKWYVMGSGLLDSSYCRGVSTSLLDKFPNLVSVIDLVGSHPRVVEWNKMHAR